MCVVEVHPHRAARAPHLYLCRGFADSCRRFTEICAGRLTACRSLVSPRSRRSVEHSGLLPNLLDHRRYWPVAAGRGDGVGDTPIHLELFLGGSGGFLWLAPVIAGPDCLWWSLFADDNECEMISTGDGINISLAILVVHGWFYVVYLFSCFRVWSLMRWGFPRFLLLATGGIVPFASFILEARTARDVKTLTSRRVKLQSSPHPTHPSPQPLRKDARDHRYPDRPAPCAGCRFRGQRCPAHRTSCA